MITVKIGKDPDHNPRNKVTGSCPVTGEHCTDVTGEHHTILVRANNLGEVFSKITNTHITRVEQVPSCAPVDIMRHVAKPTHSHQYGQVKFDGGRLPVLCRNENCRTIMAHAKPVHYRDVMVGTFFNLGGSDWYIASGRLESNIGVIPCFSVNDSDTEKWMPPMTNGMVYVIARDQEIA